jgi:RNA polymerase-binding transcription factor DksA
MVVKKRVPATGGSRRKEPGPAPAKGAAKKTAAKDAAAGGTAKRTASTGKAAAPMATDGRTAAPKAPAGKAPAKRTAAGKTAAGGTAAGKAAAGAKKAAPAKKAAATGPAAGGKARGAGKARRTPQAQNTPEAETAAGGTAAAEAPAGRRPAQDRDAARTERGVGTVEAEKTEVHAAGTVAEPGELAVLPGEEPWTEEEVAQARAELQGEVERLKAEIASSEAAVAGLMRDSGDGAGDEADTGAKNITREYEMALAANTRDTLTQATHALQRLDEGTYGRCEVCGRPIGKARMQAFPRATLCLDDKQKQERR